MVFFNTVLIHSSLPDKQQIPLISRKLIFKKQYTDCFITEFILVKIL